MRSPVVFVAGGANVDIKVAASGPATEGISTPGRVHLIPGGVARNVAEALARLGCQTRLRAVVGDDAWGEWLLAQTAAAGVDVRFVIRRPGQTGFFVMMDGRGVADTAIVEDVPADAWRAAPFEEADLVILDANIAAAALPELARRARRLALVGTSPAKVVRLGPVLSRTWLISLTAAEARALTEGTSSASDGAGLAHAVQALGPSWVLLTEGGKGLGLAGDQWTAVPALSGPLVDATGAGDTAAAVVTAGLLQGWAPQRVLSAAARAAILTLSVWGNVHPEVGTVLVEGRAR